MAKAGEVRQQFRRSLRCGTGRAYLLMRGHAGVDFSADLIKAARTNYAHDKQCEGDRAEYVAGLIELSGRKDKIVERVLEALVQERQDGWGLDQMFSLARIWAGEGNETARRAMYRRYRRKPIKGFAWAGEMDIVELDGLAGLLFIAQRRGAALLADAADYEDSMLVDAYERDHPGVDVYGALRKASRGDRAVGKYLESIRQHKLEVRDTKRKPGPKRFSYEQMKEVLDSPGKCAPFRITRARWLTKRDLRRVADDFLRERDPAMLRRYLTVFVFREYPYDYHALLKIAMGRNDRKYQLVERACRALRYFQGEDIRRFAIAKLKVTNRPEDYLQLLVSNYRQGDVRLLARIADRYRSEDTIHGLAHAFSDIYEENSTRECRRPLEILYEKLTCSLCRYSHLMIMHNNGVLSRRILREMEFDNDKETRELYRKITGAD